MTLKIEVVTSSN